MKMMKSLPHDVQTWPKDPSKPLLNHEDYAYKGQKVYTSITNFDLIDQLLGCTN